MTYQPPRRPATKCVVKIQKDCTSRRQISLIECGWVTIAFHFCGGAPVLDDGLQSWLTIANYDNNVLQTPLGYVDESDPNTICFDVPGLSAGTYPIVMNVGELTAAIGRCESCGCAQVRGGGVDRYPIDAPIFLRVRKAPGAQFDKTLPVGRK